MNGTEYQLRMQIAELQRQVAAIKEVIWDKFEIDIQALADTEDK